MKRSQLLLLLTCHCRESSFLVSESLDRELTWAERWAMRLHQAVCARCHRFAKQLRELHALVAEVPDSVRQSLEQPSCCLSPQTKSRIAEAMRRTC